MYTNRTPAGSVTGSYKTLTEAETQGAKYAKSFGQPITITGETGVVVQTVFPRTAVQQTIRSNMRNCYLVATREELERAIPTYSDEYSKECLRELIRELDTE